MKTQQRILVLLLQCFQFLFENADAVSCKETKYTLQTSKFIYFASPNYPRPFESQTQCNWVVSAPKGYRVKLQFIKFYLVNSPNICVNQNVRVVDLHSGMTDGPYCGNSLPPVVYSTGQKVRVMLQSDARNVNQLYKGFQIKAIATMQPSSVRLRDKQGKWMKYGPRSSGNAAVPEISTEGMTENEKIEYENRKRNSENNNTPNLDLEEGKKEFKPLPDKPLPRSQKPKTTLKRKIPSRQRQRQQRTTTQKIVTSTLLTSHGHGHADNELHHGFIIAIAAAIIFAVALAFVAHDQCKKRGILCGATKKEEHSAKRAESYKNINGKVATAHHLTPPPITATASLASQKRQPLGINGSRAAPSSRHHTTAPNGHDRRRPTQQPDVTSPPPPPPHRQGRSPPLPVSQRSGPIPIASSGSVRLKSPARRHHAQNPSSGKTRSTRHPQHHVDDDVRRYQRRSNPVS